MTLVPEFHTDTDATDYGDDATEVYHNQSECGYGKRVKRDGNDIAGRGWGVDFARSAVGWVSLGIHPEATTASTGDGGTGTISRYGHRSRCIQTSSLRSASPTT